MFVESVMELVLLVAAHTDERPFRDDAALLLDLLAEVYVVSVSRLQNLMMWLLLCL